MSILDIGNQFALPDVVEETPVEPVTFDRLLGSTEPTQILPKEYDLPSTHDADTLIAAESFIKKHGKINKDLAKKIFSINKNFTYNSEGFYTKELSTTNAKITLEELPNAISEVGHDHTAKLANLLREVILDNKSVDDRCRELKFYIYQEKDRFDRLPSIQDRVKDYPLDKPWSYIDITESSLDDQFNMSLQKDSFYPQSFDTNIHRGDATDYQPDFSHDEYYKSSKKIVELADKLIRVMEEPITNPLLIKKYTEITSWLCDNFNSIMQSLQLNKEVMEEIIQSQFNQ